jgi:dTDP-4-amino-4,6-dideoxygalactose transaminase
MSDQREFPFARPVIGDEEKAAVARVLGGHILTHGPECRRFEEAFRVFMGGEAHCISVSSCMAALHLAALGLGIGPGDEVLVPALTHVATAHAVEWVGARPVFVDADPETGNIAPAGIEAAITPRTRAIFLVHFIGIPCDMDAILATARRHRLAVVEDCALAIGTRWRGEHAGTIGSAGCFSFYPVKQMTTGEGGMFVTTDAGLAERVNRLRAFGVDRSHGERRLPGQYDVPWLGLNYRMSEIQAAIGAEQVARLEGFARRRAGNLAAWRAALGDGAWGRLLECRRPESTSSLYCAVLLLDEAIRPLRNRILARLTERGVGTSVYYPQPVPRMAYYREKYGYEPAAFPAAESVSDGSIALPVGPHLGAEDMAELTRRFLETIKEVTA